MTASTKSTASRLNFFQYLIIERAEQRIRLDHFRLELGAVDFLEIVRGKSAHRTADAKTDVERGARIARMNELNHNDDDPSDSANYSTDRGKNGNAADQNMCI